MSQGSYLQNRKSKRHYDDGGFEDDLKPQKKQKNKKDFSKQREQKRGSDNAVY